MLAQVLLKIASTWKGVGWATVEGEGQRMRQVMVGTQWVRMLSGQVSE